MHVVQKISVPILTYGFEVLRVSLGNITSLDNLINIAINRIFWLTNKDNIAVSSQLVGITCLEETRKIRVCRFLLHVVKNQLVFY